MSPARSSRGRLLRWSSLLVLLATSTVSAQQAAAPQTDTSLHMPAVGDMAPDFTVRGATRYGLLRDPVRLSDFRGQTVVLWLFIKARTRG